MKNIISIAKLEVYRVCKLVQGRIKTQLSSNIDSAYPEHALTDSKDFPLIALSIIFFK